MVAKPMWAGFVSAILLAFICAGIYAFNERSHVAEAQSATSVGVDANPAGNSGTSLGTINSCISVNSSPDPFYIDLVIQNVDDLNLWGGTFRFDESVLEVNALDVNDFFLGNDLWGPTFYCYEDPVGDEGECTLGTFDTTGAGHDDEGVLGRLEITAIGPGISKANFNTRPDFPTSGVTLEDENGTPIEPVDEWGYFDGTILDAEIAVDEYCPGECLPENDTDGDWFNDAIECYLGTDPLDDCPNNPSHDAWPLDIDMDTYATVVGDVLEFAGLIGSEPDDANWKQRLDLNADGFITVVSDVLLFAGHIGDECS